MGKKKGKGKKEEGAPSGVGSPQTASASPEQQHAKQGKQPKKATPQEAPAQGQSRQQQPSGSQPQGRPQQQQQQQTRGPQPSGEGAGQGRGRGRGQQQPRDHGRPQTQPQSGRGQKQHAEHAQERGQLVGGRPQQSPQYPQQQQHQRYRGPPAQPHHQQQQWGPPVTQQQQQPPMMQQPRVPQTTPPQHVQVQPPQTSQEQLTGAVRKGGSQRQGPPQKQMEDRRQPQPQSPVESPRAGGDSGVVQPGAGGARMGVQGGGDVPQIIPKQLKGRRTGGTQCRKKIMVVTNHFPLDLGTLTKAYHYDVDIVPDRPKKLYRAVVEEFRKKMFKNRYPAFDGVKNLYSAMKLCDGSMSETVTVIEDEDRKREFKVTIKQAAYIDLSSLRKFFEQISREHVDDKPMQAIQCIDVVLRSAPLTSFLPVGRSFFQATGGQKYELSDGTELYSGFYQAAIAGWKPFLNMDVTHKVFAKAQHVIEFINELTQGRADKSRVLPEDLRKTLAKHVRQLKVEYKLPNNPASRRVYRVNDIGEPACSAKFEVTDEKTNATKKFTVLEYYAKEKKMNLKYPMWPTLWVGNKTRNILIPLEFCTVLSGQAVNRAINDNERRNMIRHTATTAPNRLNKITNFMKNVDFKRCPQLDEFGIKVTEQPHVVEARVLQPPNLEYSDKKSAFVKRGAWHANRFISAATIRSWTIICLDDRTQAQKLDQLENELITSGRNRGVTMAPADRLQGRDFKRIKVPFNEKQLLQLLVELFKSLTHELIVVVIPENKKFVYHYVKQASELRAGKLTQCVKSNTVYRMNSMTADNLMLKINAKLNGTNHTLSPRDRPRCLSRPFVIMGADVTHPGPEAQNIPSVAAVTCSYDANGFKYTFSWRLQGPKIEIIQDLQQIVKDQLLYYYRKNNQTKPEYIFFFRDGVSDGQFQEVLQSELTAIRKACSSLEVSYKPRITFLVVQKRHHTRFFPTNPNDSEDKCMNVPAGTCVDTEITHPCALDFYLVSHASIQGVARPTKYRILWDDSNMSEDEIESLTYYLCHLFARCNRSVSYPTPTYYAHLAAARGKVYCETDQTINMSKLEDLQNKLMVNGDFMKTMPMYFV